MVAAIALICQDVREEKAGTFSIVGIFPDNITVAKVPFAFPKLAIYARIAFPVLEPAPTVIKMRVVFPDGSGDALSEFGSELIQKAWNEAQSKGAAKAGLIGTAMMAPFRVKQAGRINVMVNIDGVETVCGTLNVIVSESTKDAKT